MNSPQQKRGGVGCLPYGCAIAMCLILLVGGGIGYLVVSNIRDAVVWYTSSSPVTVPPSAMSPDAAKNLQAKLGELSRISNDKSATGELSLSSDELAALVAVSPFNGKVSAQIVGDALAAQFSFRMKDIGAWSSNQWLIGKYLDRYVNGSAKATVALSDGKAQVNLQSLSLNGKSFEDAGLRGASRWLSGAVNEGVGGGAEAGPSEDFFRRIERIWIADGVFHLKVGPVKQ